MKMGLQVEYDSNNEADVEVELLMLLAESALCRDTK
jgi:hypothetical protein